MRVTRGDRLSPNEAQLRVVHTTKLDAHEKAVWRGCHARGARLLKDKSITLLSTQYATLDSMSARHYAESVPVSVGALGRPPTW